MGRVTLLLVIGTVGVMVISGLPTGSASDAPFIDATRTTAQQLPVSPPLDPLGPDSWPMYLHDPAHSASNPNDTVISAANASSLVLSWSSQLTTVHSLGSVIAASAQVVGNTIYEGAWDGNMTAVNATTHAQVWRDYLGQTNSTNTSCPKTPRGITSSAAIYRGTVYVGGGNDFWYALNATTGARVWSLKVGDVDHGNYNWASPVIYNNTVLIGVSSDCDQPLVRGELIEANATTGGVLKTFYTVPAGDLGGTIWTTPTIDLPDNEIIVATGNCKSNNYAESPYCGATIALKLNDIDTVLGSWQDKHCTIDDCDIPTTPTLFPGPGGVRMVADGDKNGTVWAFKAADISAGPVWHVKVATGGDIESGKGLAATGVFTGKYLVYAGQSVKISGKSYWGSIVALNPDNNGSIVWQTPLLYNQSAFGATVYQNGAIIEGTGDLDSKDPHEFSGRLFVLNATTGQILFDYSSPGLFYDSATVALGHIFIGNFLGTLYSFGVTSSLSVSSFTATPSTISVGHSSEFSVSLIGASGTVSYVYTGLPPGCTSTDSATFACDPSTTGTFPVEVEVTDASSHVAFANTTLVVEQGVSITFTESGLPSGTNWSVKIGALTLSSKTSTIVFPEPSGTYHYAIGPVPNHTAKQLSGTVKVTTLNVGVNVTFEHAYLLTFSETGLPSGTTWNVTIRTLTMSSTTNSITCWAPNGTYAYVVGTVVDYTSTGSPTKAVIAHAAASVSVTFVHSATPAGLAPAFVPVRLGPYSSSQFPCHPAAAMSPNPAASAVAKDRGETRLAGAGGFMVTGAKAVAIARL